VSEKRFHTLSEAAFEAVVISQRGRIIDCNEQAGALVGYKREEMLGKLATDFIEPEHREIVARNFEEERPAGNELKLICRDGGTRMVQTHGRPMRNPDGESV
jgi:PAS domain S-box-containing protein